MEHKELMELGHCVLEAHQLCLQLSLNITQNITSENIKQHIIFKILNSVAVGCNILLHKAGSISSWPSLSPIFLSVCLCAVMNFLNCM